MLAREGSAPHIDWKPRHGTPYINSISVEQQPAFPGDLATEDHLASPPGFFSSLCRGLRIFCLLSGGKIRFLSMINCHSDVSQHVVLMYPETLQLCLKCRPLNDRR